MATRPKYSIFSILLMFVIAYIVVTMIDFGGESRLMPEEKRQQLIGTWERRVTGELVRIYIGDDSRLMMENINFLILVC